MISFRRFAVLPISSSFLASKLLICFLPFVCVQKLSEPLQQEKEKVNSVPRKIVAMPPPSDSPNVIPPDGGAFNSYPVQSMVRAVLI